MRGRRVLVTAGLTAGLLVSGSAPSAQAAVPEAGQVVAACRTPFTAAFRADLTKRFPGQRVTASVHDTRTGCWYSLHGSMRITTASVIKAGVMGAVLLRAQDRGRGLTAWERARVHPMITWSYNNPSVSDLLGRVGGTAGMHRFDVRMGATHTTERAAYGATVTTARDRTLVSLHLLQGGGPLEAPARATAWRFMRGVTPTQRWGITAGVPLGWNAALKNGFYPMRGAGWRVGSTGFVRENATGEGYAISVLTDGNSTQVRGITLVETVSRQVARTLTGEPAKERVVTRSRCTTTRAGQSWRDVAAKLHTTRWKDVRKVSGGNPSPLSGQRACSPVLDPR
ncbi:serine hydrolase [Angustibacter aerolatus]